MVNQNIYSLNKFSLFSALNKSSVVKEINIDEWIELIRTGGIYIDKINEARLNGKGSIQYDSIKKKDLPTITPNFIFNGVRKNVNIISSTGVIYLDFDYRSKEDAQIMKERLMNNEYVYSVFYSLSLLGCGCYIKVENVTVDNFDEIVKEFCTKFALEYDKNAIKKSQCNVLTNDKDIYINRSSKVYQHSIDNVASGIIKYNIQPTSITIDDTKCNISKDIIYNTILDNYSEDCVYLPEGKLFVCCFTPYTKGGQRKIIHNGFRNTIMSSFINNLVYLNPTASSELLFKAANGVNKSICDIPLSENEIIKILKQKIDELNKGTLQPIKPKIKKYWVNPKCANKRKAYLDKIKKKSNNSIEDFFGSEILNCNRKVTYKDIAEFTKISEVTIKRNITEEQLMLLSEYNNKFLSRSQIYRNKKK